MKILTTIYLSIEERQWLDKKARREKAEVSPYVRGLIQREMTKDAKEARESKKKNEENNSSSKTTTTVQHGDNDE